MSALTRKKNLCILSCILLLSAYMSGCKKSDTVNYEKKSKSEYMLNTVVIITWYDGTEEAVIDDCFALCQSYENMLSRTIPTSDIGMVNSREDMSVSDDTAYLIEKGLYYSALSGGAFDISVGTLTSLWNFTGENPFVPEAEKLSEAAAHVGYEKVRLDGDTVTFDDENTMIDLGAIAKGFIADKLKEYLISRGVTSATVNLGGNVLLIGEKPDGEPFNVGIQYPYKQTNTTIATVKLKDMSVVSSGVYERYFIQNDKVYHHILNPKTGYPYDNGLTQVSIISKASVDGDALSTACFALGLEEGMKLIDAIPDTYAIFIDSDFNVYLSEGLEDAFEIKLSE